MERELGWSGAWLAKRGPRALPGSLLDKPGSSPVLLLQNLHFNPIPGDRCAHRLLRSTGLMRHSARCASGLLSLSSDISLPAETNKCLPRGFEVTAQGSPPRAEISLKSHISSTDVVACFIPYHAICVVIFISQNGYGNCRGEGSAFPEDGMGRLSLYLKCSNNNHFKGCCEDQRRVVYMEMLPKLSASYPCCARRNGDASPDPVSYSQPAVPRAEGHGQGEAGFRPRKTKEYLWASPKARETGIGTPIAGLFKFLMISGAPPVVRWGRQCLGSTGNIGSMPSLAQRVKVPVLPKLWLGSDP